MNNQLSIWSEKYLESICPRGKTKEELEMDDLKNLTSRVKIDKKFEKYNHLLEVDLMIDLIESKYSKKKLPRTLFKSLSEYNGKIESDLDFIDLLEMHNSLEKIFHKKVKNSNLRKWLNVNGLSFFGNSQYELMEKYIDNVLKD